MSGEVIEVNTPIADNLETITNDCYNDGWIAKIQTDDKAEYDNLLTHEDYAEKIEKEEAEEDADDDLADDD